MGAPKRAVLYWDPAIDTGFRRLLENALGGLNVAIVDGDTVDPDPDNPAPVIALASATGEWALPGKADIVVQAGPGDFPQRQNALRLTAGDIEHATPRWLRLIEKLRHALGMASLALPAEDLAIRLDEAARRADTAERMRDAARMAESNAIRASRHIEQDLLDARKRIQHLEEMRDTLHRIAEGGAYGLALVPEDRRADVIAAREHAWRAQAAAARASEAAATHPDVIAWGSSATYSGEVRNGKPDGFGIMVFRRGKHVEAWYRGAFANGARSGHGIGMSPEGFIWSGEWSNNEACGSGQLEARDGQRYEGTVAPGATGAPRAAQGWTWNRPALASRQGPFHVVRRMIAGPGEGQEA